MAENNVRRAARLRGWLVGALLLAASAAHADPTAGDRALAETLYQEGKKLMDEKRFAEACPKLAESQRLDPGGGTLLNLASCYEGEGKLASAWATYEEAEDVAKHDGREARQKFAEGKIAELAPKLPRIVVSVARGADLPGLEIKLDGAVVGKAALGVAAPVDPGDRTIVATAPGHAPWSMRVTALPAKTERVEVPVLVQVAGPLAPEPASKGAPAVTEKSAPAAASSSRRTLAWASLGAGGVALGVGGIFGLRALSKWKERNDACQPNGCTQAAADAGDAAKSAATISDIGVVVGLAGVGVGTYLLLTEPAAPSSRSALRIAPALGPSSGGVAVGGAF